MRIFLIIITILLLGLFLVFKFLSGEKERIKTFLRIHKAAKVKFPEISEREILEIVAEEHIPPGKASQLKNSGVTGKQYLDGVFEDKEIDIDELIYHFITLEFPKKYRPFKIDLDEIMDGARGNKPSVREQLMVDIRKHKRNVLEK